MKKVATIRKSETHNR